MTKNLKQYESLGEELYTAFRAIADHNSVATFGWRGQSDGWRLTWTMFAMQLTKKKHEAKEMPPVPTTQALDE